MGEFDLIDKYFKRPVTRNALGIGDDCALLEPAAGMQLAVSSDMLVEGRHFLSTVEPSRLGHKALAVNLSDLAACGARPLAFTLALSMPQADEAWLEPFSRGLFALADEYACELVGGDTTRGPLAICITVFGEVPRGQALLRSGARAGDDIYASGTLGEARLALEAFRGTVSLPADVFEAARNVVCACPRHPQQIGEQPLRQPVPPAQRRRALPSLRRKLRAGLAGVAHQLPLRQPLNHAKHRRRRHFQLARQLSRRRRLPAIEDAAHRLQILFRLRRHRRHHHPPFKTLAADNSKISLH